MKPHLALTAAALLSLFTSACNRQNSSKEIPAAQYELVPSHAGAVYRLNKNSGEVIEISGSHYQKLDEWTTPQTNSGKVWPTITRHGLREVKFDLKTGYWDGKLYYILTVSPYPGKTTGEVEKMTSAELEADINRQIWLSFFDADGFRRFDVAVSLPLVISVDNGKKGEARNDYLNNGRPCAPETYEALKSWSVQGP